MLHAVIRSDRDAFHFFGEVSGYNLQTLREHVRQTAKDSEAVHLRVEIDSVDHQVFTRYAEKWLQRLKTSGAIVEIVARN